MIAYLAYHDIKTYNRPLMFIKYLGAKYYNIITLFNYFINPKKEKICKSPKFLDDSTLYHLYRKFNPRFGCQRVNDQYLPAALITEIGFGLIASVLQLREDILITLNSIGALGIKYVNKKKKFIVDLMDLPTCGNELKISELDYYVLRKADAVFAWSKAIEKYLRKFNINAFYLPYGIDLEIFDPQRIGSRIFYEKYPQLEGKIIIGYSGGMWIKGDKDVIGVEKIIKAYKIIEQTYRDDTVLVIQTSNKIINIINELKIKNYIYVKPTKAWYDPLRQSLFSAIDIFVAPATHYPPVYLAERSTYFQAMSRGKPIVVERTPGSAGLFRDGETALMARLDDVNDLAAKIALLIEDKNLAKRIGANARRVLEERYTWSVLAKRAYDIIKSL